MFPFFFLLSYIYYALSLLFIVISDYKNYPRFQLAFWQSMPPLYSTIFVCTPFFIALSNYLVYHIVFIHLNDLLTLALQKGPLNDFFWKLWDPCLNILDILLTPACDNINNFGFDLWLWLWLCTTWWRRYKNNKVVLIARQTTIVSFSSPLMRILTPYFVREAQWNWRGFTYKGISLSP